MDPSPEEIAAAVPAADASPAVVRRPKSGSYLPDLHRMLPQAADAEQGVIGSILVAPAEATGACWQKQVTEEWMHVPANAIIFRELMAMADEGQMFDFITVTQRLRDKRLLDQVGGPAYVTDLFTGMPTAANLGYYLDILEEKHTLREIIRVCTEHAGRAYEEQDNVTGLLDQLEASVLRISRERHALATKGFSGKELADIGMQAILRQIELKGRISGLSTGIRILDERTDGLHEQEMIVVAAAPSVGKSALCMQIIEHLAFDQKVPCAVWPLEMGRKQLAKRCIYSRARVNPYEWRYRSETRAELAQIQEAAAELAKAPLYIEDASDCTIQRIRTQARRLVTNHGVRVILIDSLSALHSDTRQGRDNRVREAAECSEGCKEMAKELNIPVILVCHISKDIPRSQRPQMSDLRETGKVSMDSDSIWFLSEPGFDIASPANLAPEIEVFIPKQRDSEAFVHCNLTFEKRFTRFTEIAEATAQTGLGI